MNILGIRHRSRSTTIEEMSRYCKHDETKETGHLNQKTKQKHPACSVPVSLFAHLKSSPLLYTRNAIWVFIFWLGTFHHSSIFCHCLSRLGRVSLSLLTLCERQHTQDLLYYFQVFKKCFKLSFWRVQKNNVYLNL